MSKLILCALAMFTFSQTPINETQPVVRYADEPSVVEPTFVEKVYNYEEQNHKGTITLKSETDCHFLWQELSVDKLWEIKYDLDAKYGIVDSQLIVKVETENLCVKFNILENSVLEWVGEEKLETPTETPTETPSEPTDTPVETPSEPEFEKVCYTYTDKNGVFYRIWLLDKENVKVEFEINNDIEIIEGVYLKIRNLLYISALEGTKLGCFFELNDSEGTFLPYVPPISKDDNDNIQFKNETMQRIWNILNTPLPIVGFSILMIGSWILVFFLKGSWGKKNIKLLNQGFDRTKQDLKDKEKAIDEKISYYEKIIAEQQAKNDALKLIIVEICKNIRNNAVQEIGRNLELELEGKEVVKNETKETTNNPTKEA